MLHRTFRLLAAVNPTTKFPFTATVIQATSPLIPFFLHARFHNVPTDAHHLLDNASRRAGSIVRTPLEADGIVALHCTPLWSGVVQVGLPVRTSVLMTYGRSSDLGSALAVSDEAALPDLIVWNAAIKDLKFGKAVHSFILKYGFLSGVSAPNSLMHIQSGLIGDGWMFYHLMSEHFGIIPTPEHHACIVDMLGHAVWLQEARSSCGPSPSLQLSFGSVSLQCRRGKPALHWRRCCSRPSMQVVMMAKPAIQFIQGTDEQTIPDVRLTKSRDGTNVGGRERKFVNGKPALIEAKYVMRTPREWDRFMRFMERCV
ncbi:hypothetical protein ABZP36_025916 [Zizania latifolia]